MAQDFRHTNSKLTIDIVTENNVRVANPSIDSTGLHTYAARYDALRYFSGGRVAEEFLINSRLCRGDVEMALSGLNYFTEQAYAMLSLLGHEKRLGSHCISLPKSIELNMPLGEVLQKRRSVRTYSGGAMALAALATIIRAACAIARDTPEKKDAPVIASRRTPSGGALYPIDLHIAALRVDSLPRGLYLYDPHRDGLWQREEDVGLNALLDALALPGQVFTEKETSAICLLVGRPWRSMRKYGDRGMRLVFLEAGAMAEHISLAAVALGFGSLHCASFYDDEAHEALEIDGLYETLIHSVFLGTTR